MDKPEPRHRNSIYGKSVANSEMSIDHNAASKYKEGTVGSAKPGLDAEG